MDKNIVILEGVIGDDAKFGKTQDGKEYYTFSLCVNAYAKEFADTTERSHSQTFVRIFIYDKRQLEYIRKVNAKRGQRASVFFFFFSFKNEYKGITFMSNNVICRDIVIIKTKKEETKNEKKQTET